jgi:circadian clock protein KaiB
MSSHVPSVPRKAAPSGTHSGVRLRLYVTGATGRSLRAMANIKTICREYFDEKQIDLKIVDLYLNPSSARAHQIFVAPTLIKELPLPACRIIGDLSEKDRVVRSLGLKAQTSLPPDGEFQG